MMNEPTRYTKLGNLTGSSANTIYHYRQDIFNFIYIILSNTNKYTSCSKEVAMQLPYYTS